MPGVVGISPMLKPRQEAAAQPEANSLGQPRDVLASLRRSEAREVPRRLGNRFLLAFCRDADSIAVRPFVVVDGLSGAVVKTIR